MAAGAGTPQKCVNGGKKGVDERFCGANGRRGHRKITTNCSDQRYFII
jgi:hypothetical protein